MERIRWLVMRIREKAGEHPILTPYIAVCVTIILIIQLTWVVTR